MLGEVAMRHRPLPLAPVLLALLACEQEESLDDRSCGIDVTMNGHLDTGLSAASSVACVVPFAYDEGIDVEYVPQGHDLQRVNLVVDGVTKGMTGAGFPATIRVDDGSETWTSEPCTVSIDEHDFEAAVEFGEQYRIRGKGQCAAPLTAATAGTGTLTLGPFEFVVRVTWGS
jgi:hypothetical protein